MHRPLGIVVMLLVGTGRHHRYQQVAGGGEVCGVPATAVSWISSECIGMPRPKPAPRSWLQRCSLVRKKAGKSHAPAACLSVRMNSRLEVSLGTACRVCARLELCKRPAGAHRQDRQTRPRRARSDPHTHWLYGGRMTAGSLCQRPAGKKMQEQDEQTAQRLPADRRRTTEPPRGGRARGTCCRHTHSTCQIKRAHAGS